MPLTSSNKLQKRLEHSAQSTASSISKKMKIEKKSSFSSLEGASSGKTSNRETFEVKGGEASVSTATATATARHKKPSLLLRKLRMLFLDQLREAAKDSAAHEVATALHLVETPKNGVSSLTVQQRFDPATRRRGEVTVVFLCGNQQDIHEEGFSTLATDRVAVILICQDTNGKWLAKALGQATASWGHGWKTLSQTKNDDSITIPLQIAWPNYPQDGVVKLDASEIGDA